MEKIKSRYSVLVTGSLEKVKGIAANHGVKLMKGSFAGDKGYYFEVEEEVIGSHPLVISLRQSKETFGVTREFGVMPLPQ